ncbi:trypsin-like peptidase domain-containing protein [Caldibacillus lycopersici]|uniref:Trypsin-like peptidase domain-containing protein n=1 Tax=Perspicuibacillus lycopersici TaxID=1325689 RepID=A0AAE3ISM0_9BACI|nr:trypsin-like peptidase domain-containing protein [Perspicuibacillus lycopersici]MCU9613457.1 trypsin-like peptidase domain-containing protein [Perspicuibacillus lycopersici]
MGYYDQDPYTEYQNRNQRKNKKGGYFLSSLIGAVIGAIVILLAIPSLARMGVLPYGQNDGNTTVERKTNTGSTNSDTITQNVSYEVDTDITKAVNKALDTVVGITNYQGGNIWTQASEAGTGSGVVYKKEGNTAYVVTNHHVIENADQLEVVLSDGKKVEATLVGSDVWTDLAVVKISGEDINKVAEFGDSDALKLGEPVLAIGNPLGLDFAGSITQGIVSGLERTVPIDLDGNGYADWNSEVLQTDAAINPGNSGGALVNIAGQVVGINSMKIAQEEIEGIGFSIPINIAIPIIEDIEAYGEVRRPYMGVQLQNISDLPSYHHDETLHLPDDVTAGLLVAEVVPGSPAAKAGLQQMDVIVKLDEEEVGGIVDLRKYLYQSKNIGDNLNIGFYRDGKYQETTMLLAQEQQ